MQKPDRAREEITSLFASHVDGIKKIYFNTLFQYDNMGPFTGFTFAVHRVQASAAVLFFSQNNASLTSIVC